MSTRNNTEGVKTRSMQKTAQVDHKGIKTKSSLVAHQAEEEGESLKASKSAISYDGRTPVINNQGQAKSKKSRGTSSSSSLTSIKKAERAREYLIKEQEIEKELEDLEYKRKKNDLTRKLRLLELDKEIETTKLENEDSLSVDSESLGIGVEEIHPRSKVENYLASIAENEVPQDDPQGWVRTQDEFPDNVGEQTAIGTFAKTLGSMLNRGFELPKREYLKFDGNPINFPSLMENFMTNIGTFDLDNRTKLSYLIQFCDGEAKNAIKNCVMLPTEQGFQRAKDILKTLYGKDYIIARAYIDKLINGPSIKNNDTESLLSLSRDMESCMINMEYLHCQSDINSSTTLERIVRRLPVHLKAAWAEQAYKIFEDKRVPTFGNLQKFVEKKALVAKTQYGQLVSGKPEEERAVNHKHFKSYISPRTKLTTLSSQLGNDNETRDLSPRGSWGTGKPKLCLFCKGERHFIENCQNFKETSAESRRKFMRKERLCDACFRRGHFARDCRSKVSCSVRGCQGKHHTLLHLYDIQHKTDHGSNNVQTTQVSQASAPQSIEVSSVGRCGVGGDLTKVSLPVVPARVSTKGGTGEVVVYALIDNCSDSTLCDERLLERLGVGGTPVSYSVSTIIGCQSVAGREIPLKVQSVDGSFSIDMLNVRTTKHLLSSAKNIATREDVEVWPHLRELDLQSCKEEEVMLLIGSDYPGLHHSMEEIRGKVNEPYAIRTVLRWTVLGPLRGIEKCEVHVNLTQTHLHKWASNKKDVLETIPPEERASSLASDGLESLPTERTLGVIWDMETDSLKFRAPKLRPISTRRDLLSVVSSVYDPLGTASPLVLPAKVILQRLCREACGWDEELSSRDLLGLDKWTRSAENIGSISFDRCYKSDDMEDKVHFHLHHFSDASTIGYGVASYLKAEDESGHTKHSLVMGKSRVTPNKPITVPRLELAAASLAVKIDKHIKQELEITIETSTFWTNSTSVLRYIENEARRFQTYVANRLAIIQDGSTREQWRYVPTEKNPADLASRGMYSFEHDKVSTWLEGPEFLYLDKGEWPKHPYEVDKNERLEWKKSELVNKATTLTEVKSPFQLLLDYHSSWSKLQRAVAWMLKFIDYLRYKVQSRNGDTAIQVDAQRPEKVLNVSDLRRAVKAIVDFVQCKYFYEEIKEMKNSTKKGSSSTNSRPENSCQGGSKLKKSSPLYALNPILVEGTVRVGGRLNRAPIAFVAKHPIILPKDNHVSNLIIRHYHEQEGHMGVSQLLSTIRQRYWIINGRAQVRKVIGNCMSCRKRHKTCESQVMAPLPVARVTPFQPAFTATGIDYFVPLIVKHGRRREKRYGCIFTCLATRAVLIEVAHSMNAESFLCAFNRFTARRGYPRSVYSDNGTNFTSGHAQLKQDFKDLTKDDAQTKIYKHFGVHDIEWHFNPPAASHAGGVWERLIRSVRSILEAINKEQLVDDETLSTSLTEVERILNDRPLVKDDDSVDSLDALTPSLLLLNRSNSGLPVSQIRSADKYNRRWRQAQWIADTFWRRWIREYLPSLQVRQKWIQKKRNVKPNDLVMVADDRVPRGRWPLGIIEEVYPDQFGNVRHVVIRTVTGTFRRDIRKICVLEES